MTATEQLANAWPQRAETCIWRTYDRDDNLLGTLMVSNRDVPKITNDTTRSIRRSVDRIVIPPRPLVDVNTTHYYADDINPLSMRVRAFWRFSDGTEFPLGKYLWGDDSSTVWSYGAPRVGALTDLCADLDQPLDDSIGYSAGSAVYDAIIEQAEAEGFTAAKRLIDSTDATLGVAVGWVAGRDTRLIVLDGLCKVAGFLPPYINNSGFLVCRAAPDIASASADFAYGAGLGGVVPGSALRSNDLLTAPNRYVVIGGNPDAELVGIFDVPDSAPNSYANTGRIRRKTDNVQGISTQAQADAAAAAMYASDTSTYTWLGFDSRVDPRHDTWNIVSFDDVNYREVVTTIECKPGGIMHHQLRGAYT